MFDEVAIQQTINRYTEGASRADWAQVMSTFLPDGIWEVPGLGMHLQGHGPIQAAMAAFVAQMAYWVQIASPAVIELEGDLARARSAIRECGRYIGREVALEVLGFYSDVLVRTPQGWKFERRTFQGLGQHTFSLLDLKPI
jgi:ketosteroid isomerase-like protein